VNAFNQRIDHAIVYGTTSYENFAHTGSSGVEVDARLQFDRGYVNANYSFQTVKGQNEAAYFGADDFEDRMLLGLPQHRGTVNANVRIYRGLGIDTWLVAFSERVTQSGYTVDPGPDPVDPSDDTYPLTFARLNPGLLWNLVLRYRDVGGLEGLELMAGAYNLLDNESHDRFQYVQPYQSYHGPMPGQPREYLFRVTYDRTF
jgi:outer membrane receptor protein involved in Fe transport